MSVLNGWGVLLGAAVAIPVGYALSRLHAKAPTGASTADLVGHVLGRPGATTAGVIQSIAYLLLAKSAAGGLGLTTTVYAFGDPTTPMGTGWWAVFALTAVVLAGLLTWQLPMRAVAVITGALAAAGLLIWFYLGLAVVARVLAGTNPVQFGPDQVAPPLGPANSLTLLALAFVGYEVCTTANSRVRTTARPIGIAVIAVVVCASVLWSATCIGTIGGSRFDASNLAVVVVEFYGPAGQVWLTIATATLNAAVLIVLVAAAARVAGRQVELATGTRPDLWVMTLGVSAVTAILGSVAVFNWGGIGTALSSVGQMLLIALYALVAHACSQLPDSGEVAWWGRVVLVVVLIAGLLIPVLHAGFTAAGAGRAVLAVGIIALAFAVGRLTATNRDRPTRHAC